MNKHELFDIDNFIGPNKEPDYHSKEPDTANPENTAEVLFLTSYPPRECGIATYSQDLIRALNNKFDHSFTLRVCALENGDSKFNYPEEVKYTFNTTSAPDYAKLACIINNDSQIKLVLIQHEFGFFAKQEQSFQQFIYELSKPVVIVFHTVLPNPDQALRTKVRNIAAFCKSFIVMTRNSANILMKDYGVPLENISVIAHGTHLVPHLGKNFLKLKYKLKDRKVLTTFGLLSSGKSIETTIDALPAIVKQCPEVIFLVIGKTHPEVVKSEGEKYRHSLEAKVKLFHLENHVKFINNYLALPDLLEYLQLTDIYLFTTNDPNQAVSGTFAYAMSCACPIISTPIPHAKEELTSDKGIIIDFRNSHQLANAVIKLIMDEPLRKNISSNTLQKIVATAWENSAIAHAMLFDNVLGKKFEIRYNMPVVSLDHMKRMTTETGIIQFSKVNQPDISTGYTLDDNARALIASCMYFRLNGDFETIGEISKYLRFLAHCQQPAGNFLNYVDKDLKFTDQNGETNLEDSNGRALWALGYLLSLKDELPVDMINEAERIICNFLECLPTVHSTRAMAFSIKGLYYYQQTKKSPKILNLISTFANRLVQMYKHESDTSWNWFESYLTYANSILPEAMLYAWELTGNVIYRDIAVASFDFLLSQTFNENGIEVISNKKWLKKGEEAGRHGEQPIDVAYTVMTLGKFYDILKVESYYDKMVIAFNWFLGKNRQHQIIYNPCTGGCYDGLEETHVNLNQGAESTVSYLMARMTMDKYIKPENVLSQQPMVLISKLSLKQVEITATTNPSPAFNAYYFVTNSYGITKKELEYPEISE
ncbi:MAG: glycosyltransferase [Bacteroidales bacterium]|nr:glycosyltransferase [Bacteroidales bacterium]